MTDYYKNSSKKTDRELEDIVFAVMHNPSIQTPLEGTVGHRLVKLIRTAIEDARKEERERIIKIIQSNSKGSFTDDGGNDCWYINDLVELLTNKEKHE